MAPISILIADDSAIIRKALIDLLAQEPDRWVVCGEAPDGPSALEKSQTQRPDVILLDLSLPGLHGLDVAKSLRDRCPDLSIVLMSEQDPSLLTQLAQHFGFAHTLPKSRITSDLRPLLLRVAADKGSP